MEKIGLYEIISFVISVIPITPEIHRAPQNMRFISGVFQKTLLSKGISSSTVIVGSDLG
jgi:hypothetical protein